MPPTLQKENLSNIPSPEDLGFDVENLESKELYELFMQHSFEIKEIGEDYYNRASDAGPELLSEEEVLSEVDEIPLVIKNSVDREELEFKHNEIVESIEACRGVENNARLQIVARTSGSLHGLLELTMEADKAKESITREHYEELVAELKEFLISELDEVMLGIKEDPQKYLSDRRLDLKTK